MATDYISRYEVKSELGRGGMATVYHAYDPNFERDVAIKVLPEVFLHDPQFRVRFEREAKTIASLEHPAIVPVYDFGESGGLPFIVMRYMSGGTLTDRISQGPVSIVETARVISRLAPALDAAHARGIIHRDIKPGNILFDQYGNAFLSDFGIAHLGGESFGTLTGGHTLGTPAYMSPEQVQGERSLDGRSDIYSLGVLAYQMLTGQLPYSADTPAKVMMMHVLQPVPHIMDARADLPSGCDLIISKALAKDREERFATSGELAAALESVASTSGAFPTPSYTPTGYASAEAEIPTAVSRAPLSDQLTMKPAVAAAASTTVLPPPAKKRSPTLIILLAGMLVIILAAAGLYFMGARGQGPLAGLAPVPTATITATFAPTDTAMPPTFTPTIEIIIAVVPTDTPVPTSTIEPSATLTTIPVGPNIGGADKIAFVSGNNIFTSNLDGTDLKKLTEDGAEKWNLQWSSDGKFLHYISGKCVFNLEYETGKINMINCFNFADAIEGFQVSPDDKQVAISLDNTLYVVPYDIEALSTIRSASQLSELADCQDFAPYTRNLVEGAQWSKDGKQMALMTLVPVPGGKQGNVIQLIEIDKCIPNPRIVDNFPPPRFTMRRYEQDPRFQNFGYNGETLFTINTNERNDGFGDLFAYASNQFKVYPNINPINGLCCYRDSQFSPDGQFLVFVFQDRLQGSQSTSHIYLIRYGDIGTGATFSPLPLPDITDPKERPQPALRPAQ